MAVVDTEDVRDDVGGSRLEDQFLNVIKASHDISMQFVSFWFDSAAKIVTKIAEAPKPSLPDPPTSEQIVEITRNAVNAQQQYVKDLFERKDPVSFLSSLGEAGLSLMKKPAEVAAANVRLMLGTRCRGARDGPVRAGQDPDGAVVAVDGRQALRRPGLFREPALLLARAGVPARVSAPERIARRGRARRVPDAKARFAAQFILDALAPTNTLLGNPAALKEAFDTGGKSLVRGAQNMLKDMRRTTKAGPPRSTIRASSSGINMAATPGAVVYRNELIELIQYDAQTEQVHEVPLLFCPPWINKYYIMDLAPGKSLIEWADPARPHLLRHQLPQPRFEHGRL
jgi:polyhydroxyalkanoate synthase